jgi:hypothetical protein
MNKWMQGTHGEWDLMTGIEGDLGGWVFKGSGYQEDWLLEFSNDLRPNGWYFVDCEEFIGEERSTNGPYKTCKEAKARLLLAAKFK